MSNQKPNSLKPSLSLSMRALLEIQKSCDVIVTRLSVRINDLEQFKAESPYACELFWSYSEAKNKFGEISKKIGRLEEVGGYQDAELVEQIHRINKAFKLVFDIKIKAPIDACLNARDERRRFTGTRRKVGAANRRLRIVLAKILHLDKHNCHFFAKASAHNEAHIKHYCAKSAKRSRRLVSKLDSAEPSAEQKVDLPSPGV